MILSLGVLCTGRRQDSPISMRMNPRCKVSYSYWSFRKSIPALHTFICLFLVRIPMPRSRSMPLFPWAYPWMLGCICLPHLSRMDTLLSLVFLPWSPRVSQRPFDPLPSDPILAWLGLVFPGFGRISKGKRIRFPWERVALGPTRGVLSSG